ncbi:MAG: LamG domain-containing protein [Planctomycetota bacterium]|nr:LamG domain-containing protein [Planctomycetota bacterium]
MVIVLGVISLALAVSYAMMRTQTTTMVLQNNAGRRSAARQAANAGLSAAMQKMHTTSWTGVGTVLYGQLSTTDSYQVSFTAGDTTITASHPDWLEYPYRVTLVSTGYSADPANPSVRASHRALAVVQLVRRQMSPAITGWSDVQNHTIYQWQNENVYVEMPFRAEGPVHLQGPLRLFDDYPYKSKPFDGVIDELALFSQALKSNEISTIYNVGLNASSGSDALGNKYAAQSPLAWWRFNEAAGATTAADTAGSNHGTYQGAAAVASVGPNGAANLAARFDGVNDYVDVGNLDLSGSAMTILAWFRADDFDYNDARIISKATSPSNDDHYWMLSTIKSGSKIRLRFRLRTGSSTTSLTASSGNISSGEWVFAAAVYDGSTMTLYKNGDEVGTTSKSGTIASNPNVPVYIGDNPPGSTRGRYLRDLTAMQQAGAGDYRTFDGPVDLPRFRSSDEDLSLLEDDQQITLNDVASNTSAPFSHPGVVPTYQLYAGGPVYTATQITDSSLSNASFAPDMQTNPLGFYYRSGDLNVYDNVTMEGTFIAAGGGADLYVYGQNVKISPAVIPPLFNSSSAVELPSALIYDDVRIQNGSDSVFRGMMTVWDEFEISTGSDSVGCDFQGRLATGALEVLTRNEWDQSESWWRDRANAFLVQLAGANPLTYFPEFVESNQGLVVQPRLQIKPAGQPVTYHWQDWSNPLFVPHPNDGALRWDLVQWMDDL